MYTQGTKPDEPTPTIAFLRTATPVGAWLLKANPEMWDIHDALTSGEQLDWWRLAHSYRVSLVHCGQPVGLWVTRSQNPRLRWGLAAIGRITSEPSLQQDDLGDLRWGPLHRPDRRYYIEVTLELLPTWVSATSLRHDPRTAGMEIFRAPRVASPVAVTPTEWQALLERSTNGSVT